MNFIPHVVILGGGFGGLYAARNLSRAPVRVTLIDRRNHHVFQPLLYQVATAALNPSDIAYPIRAVLAGQANTSVILGEATSIDLEERHVVLSDGVVNYDYLVIATGATHSYFGHDDWSAAAPGLKTIEDAIEIRSRVLLAFEAAEREEDGLKQAAWLTFVVVGGGPTGAELAGALSEIARQTMLRNFRRINPSSAKVILIEGRDRVLPLYPQKLSKSAEQQLGKLGVEVMKNAVVTHLDDHKVCIGEKTIPTRTVLWAAGVQASPLAKSLGVPLDRAGRILVSEDLSIPGHDNVFVIGDLAAMKQRDGSPVPGVAPAAIQEGIFIGKMLGRLAHGGSRQMFRYRDKGSVATIGRAAAVADFGKFTLSGFPAWFAWLGIHIFFLIGFRNRLLVMLQWAWAYVTYKRGARLITGPVKPLLKDDE